LLKKDRAIDCSTTFEEEIHATDYESPSPAVILEQSEDAELVRKAMEELPGEFREILILRHLEGCSYKEIAKIMQLRPGTVMSRLAPARLKLKERLATRMSREK
jgi:RNA polymerase sigma-70 factor (ECF subfamily)